MRDLPYEKSKNKNKMVVIEWTLFEDKAKSRHMHTNKYNYGVAWHIFRNTWKTYMHMKPYKKYDVCRTRKTTNRSSSSGHFLWIRQNLGTCTQIKHETALLGTSSAVHNK